MLIASLCSLLQSILSFSQLFLMCLFLKGTLFARDIGASVSKRENTTFEYLFQWITANDIIIWLKIWKNNKHIIKFQNK